MALSVINTTALTRNATAMPIMGPPFGLTEGFFVATQDSSNSFYINVKSPY
jgi:hypothetical protein